MPDSGYNQFCPVAMAAEVLGARLTLLLLRELLFGSARFNDLRRGVPRMSPGRYHGQSLFAWVMLFELPVMLIAGLFRLLQSVGLFR